MAGQLIAPVVDGVLQQIEREDTSQPKRGTSELGKEAFLQLLMCQMQNQDPLNPSTDTEFVAQLATFSQLEQLQNLYAVSEKSQAFNLVGKDVILSSEDSNGKEVKISGKVDFISISAKNQVKLSVNGQLYDLDQLKSVIDSNYVLQKGLPGISEEIQYTYDAQKPEDLNFEVNLGSGDTVADEVTLYLNGEILDSKYVKMDGNKVTISKEAFANLPNGEYKPAVIFNDSLYTTVPDKMVVNVVNSTVTEPKKEPEDEKNENPDPEKEPNQEETKK